MLINDIRYVIRDGEKVLQVEKVRNDLVASLDVVN